jgi:hypothetical protein
MTWPEAVVLELVVLGIVWNTGKFLTRNVRSFFDLRREVEWQMYPDNPDLLPPYPRAAERSPRACRELGFQMLLLMQKARVAFRLVQLMGFDPIAAGDNLISLAQDPRVAFRRKLIARALRFKHGKPQT